jgi:hypothetical protein
MKLLTELGLKPKVTEAKLSPGARKILETLSVADWPALPRLRLSDAQTREISRFLHGFLIFHLAKLPPGRGFRPPNNGAK